MNYCQQGNKGDKTKKILINNYTRNLPIKTPGNLSSRAYFSQITHINKRPSITTSQ